MEKEEEAMIKVVVADYCQNCPRFEAAAGKMKSYVAKNAQGVTEQYADTEIRCANASNCKAIEDYLRRTKRGEGMESKKLETMLERWREEEMRERRKNDLYSFAVNLLVALAALIVAIRV